jgi:hypothetical protein
MVGFFVVYMLRGLQVEGGFDVLVVVEAGEAVGGVAAKREAEAAGFGPIGAV